MDRGAQPAPSGSHRRGGDGRRIRAFCSPMGPPEATAATPKARGAAGRPKAGSVPTGARAATPKADPNPTGHSGDRLRTRAPNHVEAKPCQARVRARFGGNARRGSERWGGGGNRLDATLRCLPRGTVSTTGYRSGRYGRREGSTTGKRGGWTTTRRKRGRIETSHLLRAPRPVLGIRRIHAGGRHEEVEAAGAAKGTETLAALRLPSWACCGNGRRARRVLLFSV